ncbi:hypothetical protein ES708_26891 [subsurface metagenome]
MYAEEGVIFLSVIAKLILIIFVSAAIAVGQALLYLCEFVPDILNYWHKYRIKESTNCYDSFVYLSR